MCKDNICSKEQCIYLLLFKYSEDADTEKVKKMSSYHIPSTSTTVSLYRQINMQFCSILDWDNGIDIT